MNFRFTTLLSSTILIITCLSCSEQVNNFEYSSGFYKIQLSDSLPFIKYFSVDGLGKNQLDNNIIGWKSLQSDGEFELRKISGTEVKIVKKGKPSEVHWSLKFEDQQFTVTSFHSGDSAANFLDFRFDKNKNHATLLGLMPAQRENKASCTSAFARYGDIPTDIRQAGGCC